MSVENPVIDYWDGEARRIYLKSGVTTFHWIEDIYREYRYWRRVVEDSRKWLPFMRAAGNESKGGGKYTPRYVTLLDGARVIPYDENILITATGEAITDNADVDPDPFDTTTRTQAIKLYITPPASELVRAEAEIAAVNRMAFNERVTIDIINGVAGTTGNVGTAGNPVNNLSDAKIIATINGFDAFYIKGNITFANGDDISMYKIYGDGENINAPRTTITLVEGCVNTNTFFYFSKVQGYQGGESIFDHCVIGELHNTNCLFRECVLIGPVTLRNSEGLINHTTNLSNCRTSKSQHILDYNNSPMSQVYSNFSGRIKIINCTRTESTLIIQLDAGEIELDSSVTNGSIIIKGVGTLIDNSVDATVDISGLISMDTISQSVWDEPIADHISDGTTGFAAGISQFNNHVRVDMLNGVSGTLFPLGTDLYPVNNLTDASSIAALRGFTNIYFTGNYTFDDSIYVENYDIYGGGLQSSTFTFESGCVLAYCKLHDATCSGAVDGPSGFENCLISNLSSPGAVPSEDVLLLQDCLWQGVSSLPSNFSGELRALGCFGLPLNGEIPVLDMNGGAFSVQFRNYSGYLVIKNCTANVDVRIFLNSGGVVLDSTVTSGNFRIAGVGLLTDNSTGTTVDDSGLISKYAVVESIQDEIGAEIQHASFNDVVTIDVDNGVPGIAYPIGTSFYPINNLADAKSIASTRGFNTLYLKSSLTISGGESVDGFTIKSDNYSEIYIEDGASTYDTIFEKLSIMDGVMSGYWNILRDCWTYNITNFCGWLQSGSFVNIELAPYDEESLGQSFFDDVVPMYPNITSTLKMNTDVAISFTNCKDVCTITHMTDSSVLNSGLLEGILIVDTTCSGGDIIVTGVGQLINNSSLVIDDSGLMSQNTVSKAVWDESLNEITHNIPESAGRRLRRTSSLVLHEGIAQGAGNGVNQLQLSNDASSVNGAYDPSMLVLTDGAGLGQARLIYQYNGTSKVATVDRDWKVQPDDTTRYSVYAHPGREHVNEGLVVSGTINTVTLNTNASDFDDAYIGQLVFLRSGKGEDQVGLVSAYNGPNHVATLHHPWSEIPDSTTGYCILPNHIHYESIVAAVWGTDISEHQIAGSTGEALSYAATISGIPGTVTEQDKLDIADRVWNELTINHTTSGSFGKLLSDIEVEIEAITIKLPAGNIAESGEYTTILNNITNYIIRILGMSQENYYLDQMNYVEYEGAKLLTSGRIRLYSNSVSVGTTSDVIATYLITSNWTGNALQNYKVIKQ